MFDHVWFMCVTRLNQDWEFVHHKQMNRFYPVFSSKQSVNILCLFSCTPGVIRDSSCEYVSTMQVYKCDTSLDHRVLLVESVDADRIIRRIGPIAFATDGLAVSVSYCMWPAWYLNRVGPSKMCIPNWIRQPTTVKLCPVRFRSWEADKIVGQNKFYFEQ